MMTLLFVFSILSAARANKFEFYKQTIAKELLPDSTHWILSGDLNNDGFDDIISVAFGDQGTFWFKNPGEMFQEWGVGEPVHYLDGSIHSDLYDINRDGYLDLIVAYKFGGCFMHCTHYDGAIAWFENPGESLNRTWSRHSVVENFGTGVHRVLATTVNNQVFIVAKGMVPNGGGGSDKLFLHSPAKQVLYRMNESDSSAEWIADKILLEKLHLVHEMYPVPSNHPSPQSIILTSYEGVHIVSLNNSFMPKTIIPTFLRPEPASVGWISSFAYEFKSPVTPFRVKPSHFYASIENLHGHTLAIYSKHRQSFLRSVLDSRAYPPVQDLEHSVADYGGHDVHITDINCDGLEDILVAWRGPESSEKGFAIYIGQSREHEYEPKFNPPIMYDMQSINGIVLKDFNLDGILDVATVGWAGPVDSIGQESDTGIQIYYNDSPQCRFLRHFQKDSGFQ